MKYDDRVMFDKLTADRSGSTTSSIAAPRTRPRSRPIRPSTGSTRRRSPRSSRLVERFREYQAVVRDIAQAEELATGGDADMRELAQEELQGARRAGATRSSPS